MRVTKLLTLLLVAVSTIFSYVSQSDTAKAAEDQKNQLLFIYETYQLLTNAEKNIYNNTSLTNWNVTKLTMKQFNSYRQELEGKFDAVYIANGNYSPRLIPEDPDSTYDTRNDNTNFRIPYHNQPELNNDMTPYNVSVLETDFIKKGLPIFIHSNVTKQYTYIPGGRYKGAHVMPEGREHVLTDFYEKYNDKSYANVYLVDGSTEDLGNKIKSSDVKNILNDFEPARPTLSHVTNNGYTMSTRIDYDEESDEPAILAIQFKVDSYGKGNTENDVMVHLYFDDNYDTYFAGKADDSDEYEHVYTTTLSSLTKNEGGYYTLIYKMARGMSSIRNYKLEVAANNYSDYETGFFYYKDKKSSVRVLQIVPSTNESNSYLRNIIKQSSVGSSVTVTTSGSGLKISDNTKSNDVRNDMFEITIESTNMKTLNNRSASALQTYLANYNMLIFGFKDTYGWDSIPNETTINTVIDYINTGQSVFLTHDTLIRENGSNNTYAKPNNWFYKGFLEKSGQYLQSKNIKNNFNTNVPNNFYENHIGFEGSVKAMKAVKVNEGGVVTYPFELPDAISIATTHSQYLGVELSDAELIPWYNLSSDSIDSDDSSNFYYTYSKGNLTYTGAGHTLGQFSADEQKLFINTMYRSYIGANHKPEVAISKPAQTDEVLSNQKIELVGNVFDYDAQDKELQVQISIKTGTNSQKVVVPYTTYKNGSDFVEYLDHELPEGGTVTLVIDVKDERGATSTVEWPVTIKRISGVLTGYRDYAASVKSTTGIVKVGSEITINYKLTPQDIFMKNGSGEMKLSDVQFTEEFSDAFEIISIPSGASKTNNKVTYELPDITYMYNSSEKKWQADEVTFSVKVKVLKNNQHILFSEDSIFSYKDVNGSGKTGKFAELTILSRYGIDGIQLVNTSGKELEKIVLDTTTANTLAKAKIIIEDDEDLSKVIVGEPAWSEESEYFNVVTQAGNMNGTIVPVKKGEGNMITVSVTDIFGTTKTVEKKVVVYELGEITANTPLELYVGETKEVFQVIKGVFGDEVTYDYQLSSTLTEEIQDESTYLKTKEQSEIVAYFTKQQKAITVTGLLPTINYYDEKLYDVFVETNILRKKNSVYQFFDENKREIEIIIKRHYLKDIDFSKEVYQIPVKDIGVSLDLLEDTALYLNLQSTRSTRDNTFKEKVEWGVAGGNGNEIVSVSDDGLLTVKKQGIVKVIATAEEDLNDNGTIEANEKYSSSVIIYVGDDNFNEEDIKDNRW